MRNGRDRRWENPSLGHAKKERVSLFGTDQRITSGPAARRPHSKAEYMTAPERFADSQIPLPQLKSCERAAHTGNVSEHAFGQIGQKFSRQLKRISVLMDSVVRIRPPQPVQSRLRNTVQPFRGVCAA